MYTLGPALAKLTSILLGLQIALAAQTVVAPQKPVRLTAAQIYASVPILHIIAACESTGDPNGAPRQFLANGEPVWGNNPVTGLPEMKDVGELQIDHVHFPESKKMGLDVINSEEDNVYYGYLLYKQLGTEPWDASKNCWGQHGDKIPNSVDSY